MHAFDWPEQTLKIYIQYSTYFACNNDLCSAVLTKPPWGCIPQLFATCKPWRRHLRRVTSAKGSQNSEFYMLAFYWLEQTLKLRAIFSLQEWLVQSYAARLFGNTFLNFVSNFSLEGGNWVICLWQHHISKMGYLNIPFCSIFVPFHFYLIMTLVVPCLHNMFMVLLIFALGNFNIGATKPFFFGFWFP